MDYRNNQGVWFCYSLGRSCGNGIFLKLGMYRPRIAEGWFWTGYARKAKSLTEVSLRKSSQYRQSSIMVIYLSSPLIITDWSRMFVFVSELDS